MGDKTLPTKSSGLTKDDIALMVRELVLVTLPHKDPGAVPEWVWRNGNITLAIQPGYKDDPQDNRRRVCIGYPYGSTARVSGSSRAKTYGKDLAMSRTCVIL